MSGIRVLLSTSTAPWFNLAVEDAIFRSMSPDQRVLFLWRNQDTVVIGRAQNPWKECNTAKMEQDGVQLARRQSGGGAVFHDLGNTNFTFMAGKADYDKTVSTNIVLNALQSLGINGKATGRNDLVVDSEEGERKFSGSAYRETRDRGFHHGTLLLAADLTRLADYLNPDAKKLQAKGISSVRSRVTNLNQINPDISHDSVCDAITTAFFDYYGETVVPEYISVDKLPELPDFGETLARQSSWEWNFGRTPEFMLTLAERFVWGGVEIHLDINQAHITAAQIFTDSLDPQPLELLAQELVGQPYQIAAIDQVICQLRVAHPANDNEFAQLIDWLTKAVG